MSSASDNQMLVDDINELKKQVNKLQQVCAELKVNTINNHDTIKQIDDRLRVVETDIVKLSEEIKHLKNEELVHIKEEMATESKRQTTEREKLEKSLDQHTNDFKELQGEVNQLRIGIQSLKEKFENDDKRRDDFKSVIHPVLSWVVIAILSLMAGAIVYTISVTNNNSNELKTNIQNMQK